MRNGVPIFDGKYGAQNRSDVLALNYRNTLLVNLLHQVQCNVAFLNI